MSELSDHKTNMMADAAQATTAPQPQDAHHSEAKPSYTKSTAKERFMSISGTDRSGRPKADVFFRHYLHYSDGTMKEIEEIQMRKPIVNIFCSAGYVNLFLDFHSRTDADLALAHSCLMRYMSTSNSVLYDREEVEQGYYFNPAGEEELVYFPILEVALSPIGHETEYMIHGYRPAFFGMFHGDGPANEPTGLQLVFKDNLFILNESIDPLDLASVQNQAVEEAKMEIYNGE